MPPTSTHISPSPFLAYLHAYSLVCTRAFLIDLYHTVALCPFAELFNHSSLHPHSSLASDDFVCHVCGSLAPCLHDIPSTTGVVRRLGHLPTAERVRIDAEVDSVEMRVENEVMEGEEIMNTYGEGMSDGRVLIEWGFLGEEFVGVGVGWDMRELSGDDLVRGLWESLLERDRIASEVFDGIGGGGGDGERLMCRSAIGGHESMGLAESGEISVNLFAYLYVCGLDAISNDIVTVEEGAVSAAREVETAWARLHGSDQEHDLQMSLDTTQAIRAILHLLDDQLARMHRPELSLEELFEMRDVRSSPFPSWPCEVITTNIRRYQQMLNYRGWR